jgi:hypothetical protein
MSELSALRPTNEEAEKKRFLASLQRDGAEQPPYNPQFTYADMQRAESIRAKCDERLSDTFSEQALAVITGVLKAHGSEEQYYVNCWGRELESSEVEDMCAAYLVENGLQGKVKFEWAANTLVTTCVGSKVNLVPKPKYYRERRLASLLDHEVGTHFVRSYNHKRAFESRKFKHERGWLLATEEGLATLNTNRHYSDMRLWVPAVHYHACLLASRLSFVQLWRELAAFVGDDADRLWTTCLRVKRGCCDTSQPGGYYKDQSNFDGAMRLLQQRHTLDFTTLHCVRVSVEDFPKAADAARRALKAKRVALPAFLRGAAALAEYRDSLDAMAAANGIK